jgi:REP element-mobilizing transposase RayT
MSRRPRFDRPGRFHHVMNRGIARRTVFETRRDVRYFLSLLAREVRAGKLRIEAFSILTTHFHLLVASPQGDLSGVMRRVLNRYVRYFNRTRKRDGSLFRGRFRSRPVTSLLYRFILVRYIDQNAPKARLVSQATAYPYGSAARHAAQRRPRWLDSSWVDARLGEVDPADRAMRYQSVFGPTLLSAERGLVNARIKSPATEEDELDDLVKAAPPRVRAWMVRKAALADQTKPGLPYVDARVILDHTHAAQRAEPNWTCIPGKRQPRSAWPILRVGLLRDLAGQTHQQVAQALDLSQSSSQTRAKQHRQLVQEDAVYRRRAAGIAAVCLAALANP